MKCLRDIQSALNLLAEQGFDLAVLATDHGFFWLPDATAGSSIQSPSGTWCVTKNRMLMGEGMPSSDVWLMETAHAGIRSDLKHYVAAKGLATFTKGVQYFHEGLSLQECVLPVLKVDLRKAEKAAPAMAVELALTYRGANEGSVTTLRPCASMAAISPT